MKKTVYIVLLLVTVLASSCSFFNRQEAPQQVEEEAKVETMTGIVRTKEDLVAGMTAPADFGLVTDSSQIVYITSTDVNLNRYQKRRVEVKGTWNDDAKTVFLVTDVTSLGNELQVKAQLQSPTLGLKFQYPSIWNVKEQKNSLNQPQIIITPYLVAADDDTPVDTIMLTRLDNSKKVTVREYLELDDKYQPTDPLDTNFTYQQSLIGAGQMDAVKQTSAGGVNVDFYIARDAFIYHFSHTTVGDSEKDMYRNAFYDILASFEFIPFGEAATTNTQVTGSTTTPSTIAVGEPNPATPTPSTTTLPTTPETVKPTPTPSITPAPSPATTSAKTTFITYIKANIADYAPEPAAVGGTWYVTQVQFAYPEGNPDAFTAMYVTYEDGHDMRRILLNVYDRTKPETMKRIAYWKPGETADWELVDGSDTSKNSEKAQVNVSGSTTQEVVIKSGFALLDAKAFKVKIQYPSKWYWATVDGGYNFSTKPVTADNVIVRFVKGDAPTTVGSLTADQVTSVCVQKSAKFCLVGDKQYNDIMTQMSATITE